MENADLEKAGGILAFVAGISQLFIALTRAIGDSVTQTIGDGFELFGMDGGIEGPSFVWGLIFAYATVILATLLISGARGKILAIAVVVCAIVGAFGGMAFALMAVLALAGGIVALIGSFGAGGAASGVRGMMAAAQRMAEAAKEADTKDDSKETKA